MLGFPILRRAALIMFMAAMGPVAGLAQDAAPASEAGTAVQPVPVPEDLVQEQPLSPLSEAIALRIEQDSGAETGDARLLKLYEFYDLNNFAPIWVGQDGVNAKGRALVDHILGSEVHGLTPSDYGARLLKGALDATGIEALAGLEVRLSKALLSYGHDLSAGRLKPNKVDREVYIYPQGPDVGALLRGAAVATDMTAYLDDLAPHSPNYARLKSKLAEYRKIAARGGWTPVPKGETLKPGMSDERVIILRKRLVESDHHPGTAPADERLFDEQLAEAVKLFQFRHGLTPDGVVGPRTLKALNVPASARVEQMVLNMERRRWMEDDLGERYIFVNLADFFLKVVDRGKTIHTALVVVGKTYHRTPVFSKDMKYLVFNPYWNVPRSIAVKEILPKERNNPGWINRQNIRVVSASGKVIDPYMIDWASATARNFPYRFRQDSGRRNALGRVKFMFPNKFNIYLHDTPSKSLFKRTVRSFSHGCVRVQNPLDLAAVLLGWQGWSRKQIDAVVAAGKRRIVRLKTPIPVHITYLTAWVNKDGSVHFRDDIYGRDKRLEKALKRSHVASPA
ncbi:MAG TPA: peptidoglycan-binding protein [Rhizobiales bacterium]|nr:peptidoglycan-binding protein [Hyphomicrobiales bacterium]